MKFAADRFRMMRPTKWHWLVFALSLICLIPSHANCEELGWRKQIAEIGYGTTIPDLVGKELILTKALKVAEETKTSNFPEYAEIVLALAEVYAAEGEFKKAGYCLSDAAHLTPYPYDDNDPIKYPKGEQSPYMVATINRELGWLDTRSKLYNYAQITYALTQRIWTEKWGATDPRLAAIKSDMAALEYEKGDYDKAAKLFQEAIQLTDSVAKQSVFTTKPWRRKPEKLYRKQLTESEDNAMWERNRALWGYSKVLAKLGRRSEAQSAMHDANEIAIFLGPFRMARAESATLRAPRL